MPAYTLQSNARPPVEAGGAFAGADLQSALLLGQAGRVEPEGGGGTIGAQGDLLKVLEVGAY